MCTTVITRCECGYRHAGVRIDMNADTDPIAVLRQYRERFTEAFVTVKGPSVGGTRYEAEREIDARIAAELVMRGGRPIIKNRFSAWIGEDGWSLDIFGGANAPLVVAEAERSGPVTNLQIPSFCVTEITESGAVQQRRTGFAAVLAVGCGLRRRAAPGRAPIPTQFGRNRMGL